MNKYEIMLNMQNLLRTASNNISLPLTETEKKIFDLLLKVNKAYNINATLRVAGGWVRDRILGKVSKDIDIAIDKVSGAEFAKAVVNYLQSIGAESKDVGIIKSNPEQSKHLETATTFIYGMPIDFVNLRTETYADSRIPTIENGTPQEDALRRDLTINSLFYNINTGKVEDFTGKGLDDIKNGIIRTPINPLTTFLDDPLRVLRAIRFASRYGFKLDPELIEAAKNQRVKEELKNKISRERVAEELRGMLKGSDPALALELIKELGLRDSVFHRPPELREWDMDQNTPHHELTLYDHLVKVVRSLHTLLNRSNENIETGNKIILLLAAFFHDMGKYEPSIHGFKQLGDKIVSTYNGHEAFSKSIAKHIMEELKMSNAEIEGVLKLLEPAGQIENMVRGMRKNEEPSQKALARLVQKLGDAWKRAVYLAMADQASKKSGKDLDESELTDFFNLINKIEQNQSILNVKNQKSLLNGKEIIDILHLPPGPLIGAIKHELNEWFLSHLDATKQDAINFIKNEFEHKPPEELLKLIGERKKANIKFRLNKLAELLGHLAIFDHNYLFVPVERPRLSLDEELLLKNLKNRGEYHITIISPDEIKKLPPNTFEKGMRYEIFGEPVQRGLGKVQVDNDVAYFIVVDWPEAQEFRARYNLGPKDLHITMGFSNKDIHNVRKNKILNDELL